MTHTTPDILQSILNTKHTEIAARSEQIPLQQLKKHADNSSPIRPFVAAIKHKIAQNKAAVIAEIKRAFTE